MHREHKTYSYEDLYRTVRNFRPDLVGVEIRDEDLHRDAEYLKANYPHEMITLAAEYRGQAFGFDWLGSELSGRPVPKNYWREESWLKKLEAERSNDPALRKEAITALQEQQLELARAATPASINDGRYDEVTARYYAALEALYKGSRYQRLTDFYRARNEVIAQNIAQYVRRNPGRRIAIVTGADHRGFVARHLKRELGSRIQLASVPGG
jgi:hypothetical protein